MEQQNCNLNSKTLSNLKYYMPEQKTLRQLANVFFLFADETRLKIISALALSNMCVGDLSQSLSINQTTLSHQLRALKNFDIVADKREGKSIVYSLKNDFVCNIMNDAVDYILS